MGNNAGVVGGGNLGDQLRLAVEYTSSTGAPLVVPGVKSGSFKSAVFKGLGANAVLANFNVGAIVAAGLFTAKVQQSADGSDPTGSTGWSDVAAGGFGSPTTATGAIGASANDVQLLTDLRVATGQFFRYQFTLESGTSVVIGASATLGAFDVLPSTAD